LLPSPAKTLIALLPLVLEATLKSMTSSAAPKIKGAAELLLDRSEERSLEPLVAEKMLPVDPNSGTRSAAKFPNTLGVELLVSM
jgi:hypothetical protein